MYFVIAGVLSPFLIISMKGDEIAKPQKAACIFMLILMYLVGIQLF